MNTKLKALTVAILAGLSGASLAGTPQAPNDVPWRYLNGPLSPFVDTTNLTRAERAAYSIYEGILQITEGKVSATDCTKFTATIDIQADGSVSTPTGNPKAVYPVGLQNHASVVSAGGSFDLDAALWPAQNGRGQKVEVSQAAPGTLNGTAVESYYSTVIFNNVNNMMVANNARWEVKGFNGVLDNYKGVVIKDFYRGATSTAPTNGLTQAEAINEYYTIYDWGLQAISKLNYPVEKYWQRSKTRRSDGVVGRTVFVKDRLVGPSSCRITIDTSGTNSSSSVFWQSGTLTVEPVAPGVTVPQFALPNIDFHG